jgi:hypothetical protein
MKEQDFKDLLARPELNKSAIADKMYPNNKYARTTLNNKLKENQYGSDSARKLNEDDLKKGWEVLKDLADDIYSRGQRE